MRDPDDEFSFFVWHVAAGPHDGSWDPKWEIVCGELMKVNILFSHRYVLELIFCGSVTARG